MAGLGEKMSKLTKAKFLRNCTAGLNKMTYSSEFFIRKQGEGNLVSSPELAKKVNTINQYRPHKMYRQALKKQSAKVDKFKHTLKSLFDWRCREEATRGLYNAASEIRSILHKSKLVPVCSPAVDVNGTKAFTTSHIYLKNGIYDAFASQENPEDTSTVINLFASTAYIMLMRGVEDEELRIKTLKPAKRCYGKKGNLTFDVMSGVMPVIPPVFCSLMFTFLRAAKHVTSKEHDRQKRINTLMEIGQTSPEELIEVVNSFNVARAEEIFLKVLPLMAAVAKMSGPTPFTGNSRIKREAMNMLKKGVKKTVRRPQIAGNYSEVGRYSMGINSMLTRTSHAWKLKQ